MRKLALFPVAVTLFLSEGVVPVMAQGTGNDDWTTVKCTRYRKAYAEALVRFGKRGLGEPFLAAHQRFLETNCAGRADVCPVSPEEFALANALVIAGMNAGMSGTFFPFSCRK